MKAVHSPHPRRASACGFGRRAGFARAPALALVAGLLISGCGLMPKLGRQPTAGPPYIPPPEPVWVVLDPAFYANTDTMATAEPRSAGVRVRPSGRTARSPAVAEPPPAPVLPEPAPADTAAAPAPAPPALSIQVDLPAEEGRELEDAARHNLAAADSLARAARDHPLEERDREKVETALGLLRQAQEALARGDLRAAANLAYKARLLAAEAAR